MLAIPKLCWEHCAQSAHVYYVQRMSWRVWAVLVQWSRKCLTDVSPGWQIGYVWLENGLKLSFRPGGHCICLKSSILAIPTVKGWKRNCFNWQRFLESKTLRLWCSSSFISASMPGIGWKLARWQLPKMHGGTLVCTCMIAEWRTIRVTALTSSCADIWLLVATPRVESSRPFPRLSVVWAPTAKAWRKICKIICSESSWLPATHVRW